MQDSERARALEQAAEDWLRKTLLAKGHGEEVYVSAVERAVSRVLGSCSGSSLRDQLVELIEALAVDPPPSGASPQAETSEDEADDVGEICARCGEGKNLHFGDNCLSTCDVHFVPGMTFQPAPVSPVEPEPPSFEANTASNLLQKVEPEPCVWRQTGDGAWTNGCASASKPQGFYQTVNNLWSHCHFCGAPLKVEREQPAEPPAEMPVSSKPVPNLMEALKKSLDSLKVEREP